MLNLMLTMGRYVIFYGRSVYFGDYSHTALVLGNCYMYSDGTIEFEDGMMFDYDDSKKKWGVCVSFTI